MCKPMSAQLLIIAQNARSHPFFTGMSGCIRHRHTRERFLQLLRLSIRGRTVE